MRAASAEAVVLDALDRDAVMPAVTAAKPDVVVHQMTALSQLCSIRNLDHEMASSKK